MKIVTRSIAILSLLFVVQAVNGQTKFESYDNARFEYSIQYPVDILTPQDEAQNGDGRAFLSPDGTVKMLVWGQYNALFDTLKKAYLSDLRERSKGVTYKALLKKSYVISGVKDGKIFYQKTMLNGKDGDGGAVFATFTIEYDKADKSKYDPVVRKIAASFKFN